MKKVHYSYLLLCFSVFSAKLFAQPNCYLLKENPQCYDACQETYKADKYLQGTHASQRHFDMAIEKCPTLAFAYSEKSVAYLKRGHFIEWKELIDQAIELEPKVYLFYRAWCQFFFLRNYEASIEDLEDLQRLYGTPFFGMGQNGDYDLRVVLALAYKMIGEKEKAIDILQEAMSSTDFVHGLYDYLHLGVLYLETDSKEMAITALEKQLAENELAEVHYYLALAHHGNGNREKSISELSRALSLYERDRKMHSNYYEYIDQIYREDIIKLQEYVQSE